MSLSMSLVGLLGRLCALAKGLTAQIPYMTKVVALWFIAPAIAAILAYYLIRYINSRRVTDIWRRIRFYKATLIVLAFTTAYGLGANTLGLIVATGRIQLGNGCRSGGSHLRRRIVSGRRRNSSGSAKNSTSCATQTPPSH